MRRNEWSCLNRNLLPEQGMPIGFENYAAALCGKAYPLWGGSREDYENMIMGTRPCPLPQFYEMEPFVRKCHVHFPLKQCTLEANPHLVGINLHRLMTGKWRRPRLYFGGRWLSGKRRGNNSTSRQDFKNRWGVVRTVDVYLTLSRAKARSPLQQQWSMLMDHEWPLIVIRPNKTKI